MVCCAWSIHCRLPPPIQTLTSGVNPEVATNLPQGEILAVYVVIWQVSVLKREVFCHKICKNCASWIEYRDLITTD